jgi:hypothetical protein
MPGPSTLAPRRRMRGWRRATEHSGGPVHGRSHARSRRGPVHGRSHARGAGPPRSPHARRAGATVARIEACDGLLGHAPGGGRPLPDSGPRAVPLGDGGGALSSTVLPSALAPTSLPRIKERTPASGRSFGRPRGQPKAGNVGVACGVRGLRAGERAARAGHHGPLVEVISTCAAVPIVAPARPRRGRPSPVARGAVSTTSASRPGRRATETTR